MGNDRSQEDENCGKRPGAEARIFGSEKGDRHKGDREDQSETHFAIVRDQRADQAGEHRAAERARQIVRGGLERSADAHLRQDNGRQDCP